MHLYNCTGIQIIKQINDDVIRIKLLNECTFFSASLARGGEKRARV
jgi:hypothetical protein